MIRMASPPSAYQRRRRALASDLRRPLLICAGHAQARNYPANVFPFRPGSSYTYFGGPPLENAALLIEPGSDGVRGVTLFRPVRSAEDVIWMGPAASDAELALVVGLPESALHHAEKLEGDARARGADVVAPPNVGMLELATRLTLKPAPDEVLLKIIDQRLIKDDAELSAMRYAAEVSVEAHRAVAASTHPGRREADLLAEFQSVLLANQCAVPYNPIITVRGETLHRENYDEILASGDLLLIDAAAEEPTHYASDMTRTWPVDGRWSSDQRPLYEGVERALLASIHAARPGVRWRDIHDLAGRILCEALVDFGLLRGSVDQLVERRAQTLFFLHGVGHLIGLDVHDMRDFGDLAGYAPGRQRRSNFGDKFLRMDRDLAPGMCVTVEPGIYLEPNLWQMRELVTPFADVVNMPAVERLLAQRFGGIRIEHTICVRAEGAPDILTDGMPTNADEVAEMVGLL